MRDALAEAYELIRDEAITPGLLRWQIAEQVLLAFSVPKLGERLARECLIQIICHVDFPDQDVARNLVGKAEGLASELWDNLGDEPHMAELEWKEYSGS